MLAFALALMLCITSFAGVPLKAEAEEIEVTDAYVLSYDGAVAGYEYGHLPYMYKSPFSMKHSYNDPAAGPSSVWTYTYTNEIFQLINTSKVAEGGTGAYASIAVYCTDADTGTRSNTVYRRINLEDSSYHASGSAARLRSVILNSFPYVQDMAVITEKANVWLDANGMPLIQNLQIGEAMLATQQSIWKLTHDEKYEIVEPYTGCGDYDGSDAVYQDNASETETEYTQNNIIGLYSYLLSLPGTGPMDDAVSEATFENVVYNAVRNQDGTYKITVNFDVNTSIGEGDTLTLSATCGESTQTVELASGGSHSFVFDSMVQREEVKLQINGYQQGGDVYLFDAEGDRIHAQSMIGYDNSRLPVHGDITVTPDRVLNIYKTTSDEGKMPLANIEFDIYQVATLSQLESLDPEEKVILSEKPTEDELEKYQVSDNLVATLKTDVQGFATLNFTKEGLDDGVYLIVERHNPATTGPVEPFYIQVPGTTEEGDGFAYTITVNPKNTTETPPDIKKDVTNIDNNHDSFAVGQVHTWIIRAGIPAGIGNAQSYVITDTIDYRLTYQKDSPDMKLYTKAGRELDMQRERHYTLKEGTVASQQGDCDHFTISLTQEGMSFVLQNQEKGEAIPEIRVHYDAVIDEDAAMGEQIPNQAVLEYTNSAGVDYQVKSDVPEVHTGGVHLLKTDSEGKPLAGAIFKLARAATEEEIADPKLQNQTLVVDETELQVVFVDFHPSEDIAGERVTEIITKEDGKAAFYGLAYGTYYIVETKAPSGFNLLTNPITVEINAQSHITAKDNILDEKQEIVDNTIRVINTRYVMPETGGIGTTVFTVTGMGIIGAAMLLIFMNSRKKRV